MKQVKIKIILTLLSVWFFISCSPVEVNKGPFHIESDISLIIEKETFLQTISETTYSSQRPNIIVILVDDLSKHDLALYGYDGVKTANIEKLAREGVIFSHAYTSSPVCSPSRAALLTGRYQQRFGFERQPMNRYSRNRLEYFIVDHFVNVEPMRLLEPMADVPKSEVSKQGIPEEEILISEILQQAGYATGICGKWHLGNSPQFKPNNRGFDFQYGFYEAFSLYSPEESDGIIDHKHDYFANKHIWNQQRKGSCAIRVNDSIVIEEEYLTFAIARESINFLERNRDNRFFLLSAFSAPHTPFQAPLEYYNRFPKVEDHNKRVYYAMIAALDDAIGMLLKAVKEMGLDQNTLIVFASDNGGATYTGATDNGPLSGGKFSQFEGGINIPMIMRWPDYIRPGTVYSRQVSLLDIAPTLTSVAGISHSDSKRIDGVELISRLNDPDLDSHEYLYWRTDFNKAIRTEEWKLIWNTRENQFFLFSLKENNHERKNLAREFPEIVEELMKEYSTWEKEMKEPLWPGVMEFRFVTDGIETWWAI